MLGAMAEGDSLHEWTDKRLLEELPRIDEHAKSPDGVKFEIQRRLAQRQLEAAEALRKLTRGLLVAIWGLLIATAVLVIITGLSLWPL